jgi:hypothetical protein
LTSVDHRPAVIELFVAAGRQAPVLELGEETIIRRTTGLALGVVLATAVAAGWTSPAPAAEKILRLGTYGLPAGQGNPHTSTSRPTIWWWLPLYDNATYMDEKGDPGPGLALSWRAEERTPGCSSCARTSASTMAGRSTPRHSPTSSTS